MTSEFTARTFGVFGELEPGSRIAGYVIEEQIGAGGMAVVFRARDEMLGRLAAVKVIAPPMAGDPEFRARFLRESRAVAAINSQHIIPVYGAGEAEGTLYIATRFAAGGDLAALARRAGGFLAPDRAAKLVAQVASALDAAHAAGLVHRDVKPQNILIDSTPEQPEHAFLSDFGLTKGTGASTGLTAAGQFVGTPEYSAPEQIRAASVDGRADQYALGCVAFALLTGETPFHRSETVATLYAHVHDPVPSLCMIRPGLPPAIDGVIARALAKSPAARYARCGEFAAALQAALTVSVSPPFSPQSGVAALLASGGYASTIGGGNGNAGSARSPLTSGRGLRSPLTSGRGVQPKRLNGRTAVIGGTLAVAVALGAAALIYAESPTSPSQGAENPTAPSHNADRPTSPTDRTGAASAPPTASASGSSRSTSQPSSSPGGPSASTTSTATANAVPSQVTGVTATPGDGTVALTWRAPQGSATGYRVEVSPAPAGQNATEQLGAATSDTITGLTAGTTYTFTVLASNAAGDGPQSLGVTAVPFGKPLTMAAPTSEALPSTATGSGSHTSTTVTTIRVTVTVGSSTSNGSPITGYTVYEYKAASSSGPWTEIATQAAAVHSSSMVLHAGATLFDLNNDGSWYEFTATATNAAGESAQSPLSSPAIQVAVAPATSPATPAAG